MRTADSGSFGGVELNHRGSSPGVSIRFEGDTMIQNEFWCGKRVRKKLRKTLLSDLDMELGRILV